MRTLTRKESMAIALIAELLRNIRMESEMATLNMSDEQIIIFVTLPTEGEARRFRNLFSFYEDEEDTLKIERHPRNEHCDEFYSVVLRKKMI